MGAAHKEFHFLEIIDPLGGSASTDLLGVIYIRREKVNEDKRDGKIRK